MANSYLWSFWLFLEMAPVLAWEDTFTGEAVTSVDARVAFELGFLDGFAPDAWVPAGWKYENKKIFFTLLNLYTKYVRLFVK